MPDSAADPAAPRRPADRYGDRPPVSRRRVVLGLGAVAVAFTAWVVWAGLGAADRDVRWNDVGYQVLGDDAVDVTFDVVMEPGTVARCTVTALSSGFATIGIASVDVGPAAEQVVRTTTTVRTQERAVTGVVDECRST